MILYAWTKDIHEIERMYAGSSVSTRHCTRVLQYDEGLIQAEDINTHRLCKSDETESALFSSQAEDRAAIRTSSSGTTETRNDMVQLRRESSQSLDILNAGQHQGKTNESRMHAR